MRIGEGSLIKKLALKGSEQLKSKAHKRQVENEICGSAKVVPSDVS